MTPMHRSTLPIALILLAGCPGPEEQSVDAFAEAQLFHDEGNLEKAIAGYGLAIELDPHNAEAFLHRAEARLVSGDLDGAFEDCNKAIQLAPDAADAYRARAGVCIASTSRRTFASQRGG